MGGVSGNTLLLRGQQCRRTHIFLIQLQDATQHTRLTLTLWKLP